MLFGFAMLLGGILSIGLGVAVLILADFWWISILYFL
jgi:hypothetical protein